MKGWGFTVSLYYSTGKSLSETLIFASTNPQYDDRLFIELQVQYMKIPSLNLGRTCCVQKMFLTIRTFFVHNMFSPCSAKRRASDKDLPVLIFLIWSQITYFLIKKWVLKMGLCDQNDTALWTDWLFTPLFYTHV